MRKIDKETFLRMTLQNERKSNKKYSHIIAMHTILAKGEKVYFSTKNREWFKARYLELNAAKLKMTPVEQDKKVVENLYELSL